MAISPYTWGIDIGKSALKALRCRLSPGDPRKLVAEAYDYVEYPMLLSQPDADAVELVRTSLEEFTRRNELRGDRVALAVPGQLGLSKFIKLPPLEVKKIPDIVRYEARQQIPFPLDQVVWDWQRLPGGVEEGGFILDAEVAIFAMKRDQVFKALAPLQQAGVEVDILQLAPVALANMAMFDQLPPAAAVDPEKQPPAIVIVSMGVDTTDVVMTNGLRIQQRSMPIGGSTFTKALVKDMQLTFAKAEHLKRNPGRADDTRALYTAMRPVFNEFTSELQRSLNYFTNQDRSATISRVVLLGNAARLRGLADYVAKQLQIDVQKLDSFANLEGPAVGTPAFRENRLGFGTAYGLALQGAGGASLATNVMPREIIRDRLINEKRPWAVGALVGLVAAALINFSGVFLAWKTYAGDRFTSAFKASDDVRARSQKVTAEVADAKQKRDGAMALRQTFATVYDRRFQALEMLRALEACLPGDALDAPEIPDRRELHIDSIDCQFFPDLATWFAAVKPMWETTHGAGKGGAAATPAAAADPAATTAAPAGGDATAGGAAGPTGPGWVIQVAGHHFHNEDRHGAQQDEQFVRSTLIQGLDGRGDGVPRAAGPDGAAASVPVGALGIGFPVIVKSEPVRKVRVGQSSDPAATRFEGVPGALPGPLPGGPAADAGAVDLKRYDFIVQFCWRPGVDLRPPPPADPPPAAP
ncbi:MAG: type IV pilus assembly protein PilM [Planctomycetaceae bacterium]